MRSSTPILAAPRRLSKTFLVIALVLPAIAPGCSHESATQPFVPPSHVEVQYLLIGFQGTVPGKQITRTQAQADSLAHSILQRAQSGESFDHLVQTYTDDQYPGIIEMSNRGVTPGPGEYSRGSVVPGFGDTSFSLRLGAVGITNYDARTSPYGWFVIKRIR
jgi:hypothetical protein